MNIIDIHTHILPNKMPEFSKKFRYGNFINVQPTPCGADMLNADGSLFRRVEQNCFHSHERQKDLKDHAVTAQVISTVPVLFNYWAKGRDALEVCRFLNDDISRTVKDAPDLYYGLGSVPLQDPELACREAERAIRELGLKGIIIGSHVNQVNLGEARFNDFFQTLQDLNACLFIHPWDMMGQERLSKYWMNWTLGMPHETAIAITSMMHAGTFSRFPKLRMAFAHGGGNFPFVLGRIIRAFETRPDLVATENSEHPSKVIGKFFLDTVVHSSEALKYLLGVFGPNCLAMGSDYPFPLGENPPGDLIRKLKLDEKTTSRLLQGTALAWLGVKS